MLQSLKNELFYDPVYRESIMKSPSGRGLFFAPEAVKRINNTVDAILASAELHRLHFINEDPFNFLAYPSANYSAFSQLAGTLYLSDLCRSKVSVDGIMFFQWLLDKNLLEEYIIALLLDRMIRLPVDRVFSTEEPFSAIKKWEVIGNLLDDSGTYYDAWKAKFRTKSEINTFKTIKDRLQGTFDASKVVRILKENENLEYELQVLRAFVSGELELARTDRTFRLAFCTGKNYENLNIDSFFQSLEINKDQTGLKFSIGGDRTFSGDKTSKQLFKFYTTYYEVLLPEIILHQDACFNRGLFRKSLSSYVNAEKNNGMTLDKIISDTLFLNDLELWHKFKAINCRFVEMIFYGQRYFNYYRKEIKRDSKILSKNLAATHKILKRKLQLDEKDLVVDIISGTHTDSKWLSPECFPAMKEYSMPKRFKNIEDKKNMYYISFFTLKEVSDNSFKKLIDEVF
jgi:HD superfamily phosphohydrolase